MYDQLVTPGPCHHAAGVVMSKNDRKALHSQAIARILYTVISLIIEFPLVEGSDILKN